MAISLTMSNFNLYEPMRKNKYAVKFLNFADTARFGAFVNQVKKLDDLTIACHSATLPQMTIGETEIHRINDRAYLPTKAEFGTVDISFYEYITSENMKEKGAGDTLWEWQKLVYDPTTGVMRPKSQITANVLVMQFDGLGNIIRTWNLYSAWPTVVAFDELSAAEGEVQSVTATLRFDWADMQNYSFGGANSNDSKGDTPKETTTPDAEDTTSASGAKGYTNQNAGVEGYTNQNAAGYRSQ